MTAAEELGRVPEADSAVVEASGDDAERGVTAVRVGAPGEAVEPGVELDGRDRGPGRFCRARRGEGRPQLELRVCRERVVECARDGAGDEERFRGPALALQIGWTPGMHGRARQSRKGRHRLAPL